MKYFVLILAAIVVVLPLGCDTDGSLFTSVAPGPFADTWMATDPIQCLGNPWEQDWIAHHNGKYESYPRDADSQKTIIAEYYAGLGIAVEEIVVEGQEIVMCAACICKAGYTLYLLVPERDADELLRLGYRRESPSPID